VMVLAPRHGLLAQRASRLPAGGIRG